MFYCFGMFVKYKGKVDSVVDLDILKYVIMVMKSDCYRLVV